MMCAVHSSAGAHGLAYEQLDEVHVQRVDF